MPGLHVLLVTTWDKPCGIAEHSSMLKEFVEQADPGIMIEPCEGALDPNYTFVGGGALGDRTKLKQFDVVHLNYHAALHSRWDDDAVVKLKKESNIPVVITYHDTYAGTPDQPNSDKTKALCGAADAFVVHEPIEDLLGTHVHYWRQGVLPPEEVHAIRPPARPIVGTTGFDFAWKNFDLLAKASYEAGWAVLYVGGNISEARQDDLRTRNPNAYFAFGRDNIRGGFADRREVVRLLSECDATAFPYTCHNTGTSGAVRMGIAARKPVILMRGCRQFRDLFEAYPNCFLWPEFSVESIVGMLTCVVPDNMMHWVAEQDGWPRLAKKYAALYREIAR